MLFNTIHLPAVRLQLRNTDNRSHQEVLTSLLDRTGDKFKTPICNNTPSLDFKYLLYNKTTDRSLAFTARTVDVTVKDFLSEMGEVTLLRITGYAPSIDKPTIATKPVIAGPEHDLLIARFPFLKHLKVAEKNNCGEDN